MASVTEGSSDPVLIDQAGVDFIAAQLGAVRLDAAPVKSGDGLPDQLPEGEYAIKVISSSMTATGPEYRVNLMTGGGTVSNSGLVVLPDTVYLARNVADDLEAPDDALADGTVILNAKPSPRDGKQILIFDTSRGAPLPTGEYQYMVLQMVADNEVGYDFNRAHPIISG